MSRLRAWQHPRSSERGTQRLSCVEIDLARQPGGGAVRLEYQPLAVDDRTRQMAGLAEFMSVFGPQAPAARAVLVVARRGGEQAWDERYPRLPAPMHRGATVIAADAGEVAVLFSAFERQLLVIRDRRPRVAPSAGTADADAIATVLDTIWAEERVFYHPAGKQDFRSPSALEELIDLVVPMGDRGGFASETVAALKPDAAFNGGYFLWIEDETRDPYSFTLDHVGLAIRDGEVISPPLFRRSAVLVCDRVYGRASDERRYSLKAPRVTIRELSMASVSIRIGTSFLAHGSACAAARLPREHLLPAVHAHTAQVNPAAPGPDQVAFYTRMLGACGGDGRTCTRTPTDPQRAEWAVVGREVCSTQTGGAMFIPMNGFVLSVPVAAKAVVASELAAGGHRVRYAVDTGDGDCLAPRSGVQVGPRLVRDGARLDVQARLTAGVEEFRARRPELDDEGIPPVYVTTERQLQAPIARIGLGLRPDARCIVAMLEGCEPRTAFSPADSVGVTAAELADELVALGCSDVVQLDGGGSAAMYFDGRPIAKGADRNDIPFVAAERAVAGAWLVWEA